uniref:(northern house mosquito) hypothetical protein n=1 Tax=Culex pipiens TaxID=7175 RepID=A0A8D8BMN0_CULPI
MLVNRNEVLVVGITNVHLGVLLDRQCTGSVLVAIRRFGHVQQLQIDCLRQRLLRSDLSVHRRGPKRLFPRVAERTQRSLLLVRLEGRIVQPVHGGGTVVVLQRGVLTVVARHRNLDVSGRWRWHRRTVGARVVIVLADRERDFVLVRVPVTGRVVIAGRR